MSVVLLGNGNGTFSAAVNYQLPNTAVGQVAALAVEELNGDGKPDLVAENGRADGRNVSVLLGNGNGTFQTPKSSSAMPYTGAIAVADFDGDGKLDVIVTAPGTDSIGVLRGKGDGTFQPALNYSVGGGGPVGVAVGDFDGDGNLDVVTANLSASVSEVFGNGDGTFQAPREYRAIGSNPSSVWSLATGDFNGIGKLDLAAAIEGNFIGDVSVLLGKRNGDFQLTRRYSVGQGSRFVAAGDFDGDGKLDLVTADDSSNNVNVLLGNGDGSFKSPVPYPVGSSPYAIGVGDFDHDGKLDLAVANFKDNSVSVLLGNGNGTSEHL